MSREREIKDPEGCITSFSVVAVVELAGITMLSTRSVF